jgi:nucleoside-diphosphate-sugar epimerase
LDAGKRVIALTRGNAAALRAEGIEPVTGDVLDPHSLANVPAAGTVLFAVGWDRSSGRGMREVYVTGLSNLLTTLPHAARFIYASSTGVYGQTGGEWVDEASATEPREESGKIVLEAERLLRDQRPDALVLRFAGMYGPNRLLRQKQVTAGEPLVGDADRWLNLIHIDDAATAVVQASTHGKPGETYVIADDEPVTRRDYYNLVAELLGAPAAKYEHKPEEGQPNRRVRNGKAKDLLSWRLRYPSFRDGLPAAVSETQRL